MSTADMRSAQLTELFNGLGQLTSAVVGGDGQLTALLDSGDRAVASLAQMMTTAGDSFARSLTGLRGVTKSWMANTPAFETFLDRFPVMADRINHSGRYGGFMMLYLCNFTLKAWDPRRTSSVRCTRRCAGRGDAAMFLVRLIDVFVGVLEFIFVRQARPRRVAGGPGHRRDRHPVTLMLLATGLPQVALPGPHRLVFGRVGQCCRSDDCRPGRHRRCSGWADRGHPTGRRSGPRRVPFGPQTAAG